MIYQQLLFTDDGSLGEYDLAEAYLSVKCEKYRSSDTINDVVDSYRSFKVITFNIPLYKYPVMDALTIFIPLVLISILTLFSFSQGPDYNDKIGNIATLMIVYVGLIPVIRLKDSLCSLFRLSQVSQVSTGFDERLQLLSKLMFTSLEMSPLLFLSILRKRERIISLCLL